MGDHRMHHCRGCVCRVILTNTNLTISFVLTLFVTINPQKSQWLHRPRSIPAKREISPAILAAYEPDGSQLREVHLQEQANNYYHMSFFFCSFGRRKPQSLP